jgi:hypothetical protein
MNLYLKCELKKGEAFSHHHHHTPISSLLSVFLFLFFVFFLVFLSFTGLLHVTQLRNAWAEHVLGLRITSPLNYRAFVKAYEAQVVQAVVRKFKATNAVERSEKEKGQKKERDNVKIWAAV